MSSPSPNDDFPPEISAHEVSLARSRDRIRVITKSILDLVNERQKLSLSISKDKMLLGQPITNPEVEQKLLSDAREYAKSIGLNEDFAQGLVSELINFSKEGQTEDVYRRQIEKFLDSRKIRAVAVVGIGRMGVWFARYFKNLGLRVLVYDERVEKSYSVAQKLGMESFKDLDKANEADLTILSVPISKIPKLVNQLRKSALDNGKNTVILEISSIKNEIGNAGLFTPEGSDEKSLLYSIHPLFGGSAPPFAQNSIIQSYPKDMTLIRGLFPQFNVVSMEWNDHDRLMGLFLTYPHVLSLVFADALHLDANLWNDGINLNGPSFSHMFELSKRVLSEDPEVYFEIQSSNPNSKQAIEQMMKSLLKIEKGLDNRSDFIELFELARKKFSAMEKSQAKTA